MSGRRHITEKDKHKKRQHQRKSKDKHSKPSIISENISTKSEWKQAAIIVKHANDELAQIAKSQAIELMEKNGLIDTYAGISRDLKDKYIKAGAQIIVYKNNNKKLIKNVKKTKNELRKKYLLEILKEQSEPDVFT